ncbi:hypothetical protein M758_6G072500 [Ceratodon purpureus]|uniref:Uncharacterized protein n=1 Tax=Ceratodon purpureus TaxID=3225 RepID=A0A8T0HF43_CERPU|nr:hypothetical protein KC19_6G077000 [Ceratodon purpureus]KAG0613047.1 hypothetical protein M758_6G072500 [Ceratodon purpureus]
MALRLIPFDTCRLSRLGIRGFCEFSCTVTFRHVYPLLRCLSPDKLTFPLQSFPPSSEGVLSPVLQSLSLFLFLPTAEWTPRLAYTGQGNIGMDIDMDRI